MQSWKLQEIKKGALLDYVEVLKSQLHILKDDPYVQQALVEFDQAFEAGGDRVDTTEWQAVAQKYDARMKDINEDNGWYDLFLMHTDGDVVYSVCKESDLGMVIPDSSLKDSSLGVAFAKAQKAGSTVRLVLHLVDAAVKSSLFRITRKCAGGVAYGRPRKISRSAGRILRGSGFVLVSAGLRVLSVGLFRC